MADRSTNLLTPLLLLLLLCGGGYLAYVHEQQMAEERAELRYQLDEMRREIAYQRNGVVLKSERANPKAPAAPKAPEVPAQHEEPAKPQPEIIVPVPQYQKPAGVVAPEAKKDDRADDIDRNAAQIAKHREEEREDARATREARLTQISANKAFYDAQQRKETAQRAMIAWKNKLAGAIKDRDRAIADQAAAAQGGVNTTRAGATLVTVDTRGNVQEAMQRREAAEKAITEAQNGLAQSSRDFAEASRSMDSAQVIKENADRTAQVRIPPKQAPKFTATYTLADGRILTAIAVITTDDEYWIKTQEGIEAVKKDDVTEILK